MQEEEIPPVLWKGGRRAGKNGQEMILECADGMFSCIAAVDMRWHELVAAAIVCNSLAEHATAFIVHNVDGGWLAGSS